MLTDAAAIAFSLVAIRLAARPAQGVMTYGLKRVEILSAQANGVTLLVLALADPVRGRASPDRTARASRAGSCWPSPSSASCVNLAATWTLSRANRASLNVEGSFQHILTDLYAFIATAIAGAIVLWTGWLRADPIASLLVAALMLRAAYGLLRDSGRIFLEASPSGPRPRRDRTHAGRAALRERGARPARLGDLVRLPRTHGARAGLARLRLPRHAAAAGGPARRALRDRAHARSRSTTRNRRRRCRSPRARRPGSGDGTALAPADAQTPIGCQTVFVSTKAVSRSRPGSAAQSSSAGTKTRLTLSAAARCSSARSAAATPGEVDRVDVAVAREPGRELGREARQHVGDAAGQIGGREHLGERDGGQRAGARRRRSPPCCPCTARARAR